MKRHLVALAVLLALAPSARAEDPKTPACVSYRGEAMARAYGYDHVVTIDNACPTPVDCSISTDVAPEPIRATVKPKERVMLTTFRGSPASVFTPKVACALHR